MGEGEEREQVRRFPPPLSLLPGEALPPLIPPGGMPVFLQY